MTGEAAKAMGDASEVLLDCCSPPEWFGSNENVLYSLVREL
jgi:hypothetical protein